MLDQVREQGQVRNRITRFRTRSGELLDTIYSADIIELDGQQCLLAVSEDLPERANAATILKSEGCCRPLACRPAPFGGPEPDAPSSTFHGHFLEARFEPATRPRLKFFRKQMGISEKRYALLNVRDWGPCTCRTAHIPD